MNKVNRQEQKFYINKRDTFLIETFLENTLLKDTHSSEDGYRISSLYFDTQNNDDLNQKLDGIMFREKYRIRIYDNDISSAKFEVKRKLNNCIEKISTKLSIENINEMQNSNYSVLNKFPDFEYVSKRMEYLNYLPINIVSYNRVAYYLPINNIRVTIDKDLRTHGFSNSLTNNFYEINTPVQNTSLDILEIKFEDYLPNYIKNFLSSFKSVRSSISKYSLCRVHNNTEIHGDDPLIPF